MYKIYKVAQREYNETVKTKTFILGVLMTPLIIGGIIYFSSKTARSTPSARPPKVIVVTDQTGELADDIRERFQAYNAEHPDRQILPARIQAGGDDPETIATEKEGLRRGEMDAYVVLEPEILDGRGSIQFYSRDTKASDLDYIGRVENLLNQAVINKRCQREKLDAELIGRLRQRVGFRQIMLGAEVNQERQQKQSETITRMMLPFFFMYLMFLGIMGMGQQLLTSVIEEKNSRVIEVLLSAVTPFELMAGKILGLAAIGVTMMTIWCAAAYGAARWQGMNIPLEPNLLFYFVIYYVLGFLFFSSLLVGIGSVCNTIKEAQSLMMPVTMLLIIPLLAWYNLARNPEGTLAVVLSFIPPTMPLVMILRICASEHTPFVQILISLFLLATCVLLTTWAAAKVFRTGILMYGKRPGLREILRWLRQS
ncbi:MAG: ABC transporter permease [Sedimentisphaerales bacterium]|nr:ABC transporter permease [Sedimentisphaerales bacterium]